MKGTGAEDKRRSAEVEEVVRLLTEWVETFDALNRSYDALRSVVGGDPNSPLPMAAFKAMDRYTEHLSHRIGDEDDWLQWFLWDNDSGRRRMQAKAARWGRAKRISDVRRLAELVVDSRAERTE